MSIVLRKATQDDIDSLVALDSAASGSAERRNFIREWTGQDQCYVAVRDGEIAGYAVLTRAFFHRPFVELVMVAPATRRQGIGLALVAHLVGVAPAKQNLWTSTNVSNAPMRELLAKAGFVQSGQVDNLDEGDPEVIFVRRPDGA